MADRSWRRELKRTASGLAARLWRRPPLTPAELRALRPARILIARPHNQLGDMVCATPVFRAVREAWPRAEIALICAPVNRDVVRHSPHLDRVILFDKKACTRPGPLRAFLGEVRAFGPELALVPNSVSYSVTSAGLALLSGARWVVGCDSAPFGFHVSRHAYSLELPSFPVMDRHAVDHHLAPFEAVGIAPSDRATLLVPSAEERARAAAVAADVPGDGPLWILHPGAAKPANLWPVERFAEVVRRATAAGRRLLVLQGPADAAVLARLRTQLQAEPAPGPGAWRELPAVTVGVVAALLARCDRFLCNDTGLMHVAGAVGAPTVALFGPTDPALWAPRHPALRVLRGAGGRVDTLTTDQVWRAYADLPGAVPKEDAWTSPS